MSVTRLVAALAAGAAAAAVAAARPADAKTYLLDRFEGDSFSKNWVQSSWKPEMGKWDVTSGDWFGDEASARGMRTSEDARFYAVSRKFDESFTNEGKDLVVQFAVKNEKKGSSFCAGGYIKLLPSGTDQAKFGGDSPYHIMFGPDVCGYDVSRVHLIFHKDGENMLKKDDIKLEWADKDEFTHLYTLVVKPDNTYQVLFDGKVRSEGNLGEGAQWSKFAPKEIDDANAKKPSQEEWDERETILDEADVKPADWDDDAPQTIPDPNASQPADWNTEEDGEWSAPQIPNPKYRGVWKQKTKPNPAYKGKWTPPKVPNPAYTGKDYIYKDIGAVGFELWVVNSGTIFSNVIVTDSLEEANKLADETFHKHVQAEKDAKKAWDDKNKPADAAGDAAGDAAKDAADEDKDEL